LPYKLKVLALTVAPSSLVSDRAEAPERDRPPPKTPEA